MRVFRPGTMPFLDTNSLPVIERLPGWHGRYFHSQNMTFAHYDFARVRRFTNTSILRKKSMRLRANSR